MSPFHTDHFLDMQSHSDAGISDEQLNRPKTTTAISVTKKTKNECHKLVKHTWDADGTAEAFLCWFNGMEITGLVHTLIICCKKNNKMIHWIKCSDKRYYKKQYYKNHMATLL